MINFKVEKKFTFNYGIITMKDVGGLANAIRRVLLDEIETIRFNISEADFSTSDHFLTYQTMINLSLVHLYEEGEFYIDVANNTTAPITVTSDLIKTIEHKPAKVEKMVFICTLQPHTKIKITKISSHRGIGRDNAKFSPIFGQVEYIPTDVMHVLYLNDRGFIELSRKCIKITKDLDPGKQYILWSKIGAESMSEKDKEFCKNFIKLKPEDYDFRKSEYDVSRDFIIKFRSHFPKEDFQEAVKVLLNDIENEELTITTGELLRQYVYDIAECPIYAEYRIIEENYYSLTIDDPNAEKLKKQAIEKIKKILKNINYK